MTVGGNKVNMKTADEKTLLENFNNIFDSNSPMKNAKDFLNQRLMIGDNFSRTLRKHLNVVSDSNTMQAKLL